MVRGVACTAHNSAVSHEQAHRMRATLRFARWLSDCYRSAHGDTASNPTICSRPRLCSCTLGYSCRRGDSAGAWLTARRPSRRAGDRQGLRVDVVLLEWDTFEKQSAQRGHSRWGGGDSLMKSGDDDSDSFPATTIRLCRMRACARRVRADPECPHRRVRD